MRKILVLVALCFFVSFSAHAEEKKSSETSPVFAPGEAEFLFLKSNIQGFSGDIGTGKKGIEQLLLAYPDSAFLHFVYAQYLVAEGEDPQTAIVECETSLKLDSHASEVKLFLAKIYANQVESAKAAALFEEVLKQKPQGQEVYMLLAQEYVRLKQYQKAVSTINRLVKTTDPFPEAYMFLGTIYGDYLKNVPQAISSYQKVLSLDENFSAAIDAMADLYVQQKQPAKALQLLESLVKKNPHDPTLALRVALLYYEQKKYGEAILQLNDILRAYPSADKVRYYLGTLYQEVQEFDGAKEAFLGIPPESLYFREARIRLVAQYKNQQQPEEAKKLLYSTIEQQKEIPLYYELLAAFFDEEKNTEKSIEVLEMGIAKLPKDERLRLLLAMLYERKNERKKAQHMMEEVLKLNSDNPTALNYIAYMYAENGKKLEKAEEFARHAVELKPDDAYVVDTLGWVLFKQNRLNEAKSVLENAAILSPDEPTIHYHLGEVFMAEKNSQEASAHFLKARDLWLKSSEQDKKEMERLEKRLKELSSASEEHLAASSLRVLAKLQAPFVQGSNATLDFTFALNGSRQFRFEILDPLLLQTVLALGSDGQRAWWWENGHARALSVKSLERRLQKRMNAALSLKELLALLRGEKVQFKNVHLRAVVQPQNIRLFQDERLLFEISIREQNEATTLDPQLFSAYE